ncbi:methylated-DNA--[protein]-cysteine S-methyltransferase [Bacillus salitolerans]|uniref:Methylated-DNA--protein-cysteine methyltransferase n=1 Tax=Bacillus salitolerans TaxID=1437434 RepID=A0ABW4LK95_9BACI
MYWDYYESIIGKIYIVSDATHIRRIIIGEDSLEGFQLKEKSLCFKSTPLLKEAVQQLQEYFCKKRKDFELPLKYEGTDFQQSVWEVLKLIPYGKTISYSEVANQLNNPKSVRAVGQANRKNQLPIVIPCHRVIGKNNQMTGYAGNKIGLKQTLLQIEGALI